jgi:hypothetical protein
MFFNKIDIVRRKIDEITKVFGKLEHLKNRGVTFWSEKNQLLVAQIFDQL